MKVRNIVKMFCGPLLNGIHQAISRIPLFVRFFVLQMKIVELGKGYTGLNFKEKWEVTGVGGFEPPTISLGG